MLFVNPYTWSPNEAITSQKLNYLGQYLTTYLNGANIAPSQLSSPYANTMLHYTFDIPADPAAFLAANSINYYAFTFPAANWNLVIEKVAVEVFFMTGGYVEVDILNSGGTSVLVGAAPKAVVAGTESSNTNSITLASGNKYRLKVKAEGTGVENYQGVSVVIYGKMLLRS